MRLIAYMAISLPLFQDVQEQFETFIPVDMLVSIAGLCKPDDTVERISPVKSKKLVSRVGKAATNGRIVKPTPGTATSTSEQHEGKVDIDASELGRSLVAFASSLGYDLPAPPEV
jgi:hypothetical protein